MKRAMIAIAATGLLMTAGVAQERGESGGRGGATPSRAATSAAASSGRTGIAVASAASPLRTSRPSPMPALRRFMQA